jgi:hypothetical protein
VSTLVRACCGVTDPVATPVCETTSWVTMGTEFETSITAFLFSDVRIVGRGLTFWLAVVRVEVQQAEKAVSLGQEEAQARRRGQGQRQVRQVAVGGLPSKRGVPFISTSPASEASTRGHGGPRRSARPRPSGPRSAPALAFGRASGWCLDRRTAARDRRDDPGVVGLGGDDLHLASATLGFEVARVTTTATTETDTWAEPLDPLVAS